MSDMTRRIFLAAVSLALTVAVITTYLFFYKRTEKITDNFKKQTQAQQEILENYSITRFNDAYVYGSQVIGLLKRNVDVFQEVYLDTIDISDKTDYHNLDSPAYINTNQVYFVHMDTNENGVLTKIHITTSNTP